MTRQSGKALAGHVAAPRAPRASNFSGSLYAAALAPVGTEAIVFRICEAIW
jgi:hypothetical protein